MRVGIAGTLVLAVVALACGDPVRPELSILTDKDVYVVPQPNGGPFVGVTVRNVSERVIVLAACGGTDVLPLRQRLRDGEWADDPLATCAAAMRPKEFAPGDYLSLGHWNFFGATGTFRFRVPLYRDSLTVSYSHEVSPTFSVH